MGSAAIVSSTESPWSGGVLWRELCDRQTASSARDSFSGLRCTLLARRRRETTVNAT
jgi:hypothetical protein